MPKNATCFPQAAFRYWHDVYHHALNLTDRISIGGFTKMGDPIDPQIVGSPYKEDPKKVPLFSEAPKCGLWRRGATAEPAYAPLDFEADDGLARLALLVMFRRGPSSFAFACPCRPADYKSLRTPEEVQAVFLDFQSRSKSFDKGCLAALPGSPSQWS